MCSVSKILMFRVVCLSQVHKINCVQYCKLFQLANPSDRQKPRWGWGLPPVVSALWRFRQKKAESSSQDYDVRPWGGRGGRKRILKGKKAKAENSPVSGT